MLVTSVVAAFAALQDWTVIKAGTDDDVTDVSFIDETNGWAVTTKGHVLRTDDGATTWSVVRRSTDRIDALCGYDHVYFKDAKMGWLTYCIKGCGCTPARWQVTRDGGVSWEQVDCLPDEVDWRLLAGKEPTLETVLKESWLSVDNYGVCYRAWTADGHRLFSGYDHPSMDFPGHYYDVDFVSPSEGWLGGYEIVEESGGEVDRGMLLWTPDGGRTWTRLAEEYFRDKLVWRVAMLDRAAGFVATIPANDDAEHIFVLHATEDGGETWRESRRVERRVDVRGLVRVSPRVAVAVGSDGLVLRHAR